MKVNKFETAAKCAKELGCENQILKSKISELNGDMKTAHKEVKILNKEIRQMENDFLKKSQSLEAKLKSLAEFKADKQAEQKDFQSKEKLLKKKMKAFEEEKAKLSVTRNKIERYFNHNKVAKDSVSSQTEHHIDIPYHISYPLPPIFSSNLFHRTPPIKFLSSSLPNLNTILWVLPDTSYRS